MAPLGKGGSVRITYLTSARLPTEKAYGFAIAKQCEALALLGHKVALVFPRLAPRQAKAMCCEECPDLHSYFGVRPLFQTRCLRILGAMDRLWSEESRVWPLAKSVAFSVSARTFMPSHPAREPGHLVWTRDLLTAIVLLGDPGAIRYRVVFEAHNVPGRSMRPLLRILNRSQVVVATTDGIEHELIRLGVAKRRILVARSGVDLDMFNIVESKSQCRARLGLPLDRPIVGYVGKFRTFEREKGIPELIAAMRYMTQAVRPTPLLLCVGGPLDRVDEYYQVARANGVDTGAIRFEDFRPRQEVPYWLKACDVCAIPLPEDEGFFSRYTSPMKAFESMAVGTPIVASSVESMKEIVEDGVSGILVPPGNSVALGRALARLILVPGLASRLSANASRNVSEYTWTNRAVRILDFVRSGSVSHEAGLT